MLALVLASGPARADDAGQAAGRDAEAAVARTTLHTLIEQLESPDRNMRRAAARSMDTLGPSATPAMAEALARFRPGRPPGEVESVLRKVHVPDAGGEGGESGDRLDAVLDLQPGGAGQGYGVTVVTLSLVRALAHIATPEAVASFAPVALDARGAFSVDVQRYLTALGERATAGLVLVVHSRSPQVAKWGATELETLGKRTPGDAVQTKSKEVLANVLLAYGSVQDADALPVVMSFVNADRRLVRDAAREALLQYGDLAVPKLREAYGLLAGEAPPMDWPPGWLRKKLYEALDRVRLEDVDTRVQEGLAHAREGRFAEAVADFDDVLARQPDWDKKPELAPAYVFYAETLIDSEPTRAKDFFEKALRLDPSGPRAGQIESALALLEGRELENRGIADVEPYRRSLSLDPANAAAQGAVLRLEGEADTRRRTWERRILGAGGALATLSLLILFVGGRRRR